MRPEIDAYLESIDAAAMMLEPRDSYDRAVVGIATKPVPDGVEIFAVYDKDTLLGIIAEEIFADDPDSLEDAWSSAMEHFDFNIGGAYIGPSTPGFLLMEEELVEDRLVDTYPGLYGYIERLDPGGHCTYPIYDDYSGNEPVIRFHVIKED